MNTQLQQLLLILVPIVVPYVIMHAFTLGASLYHRLTAKLPANQRATLDYIASKAVTMVEQKYKSASGTEKRMYAETAFYALCAHFNATIPDRAVVDAFIEAAVSTLDQEIAVQGNENTAKVAALSTPKS